MIDPRLLASPRPSLDLRRKHVAATGGAWSLENRRTGSAGPCHMTRARPMDAVLVRPVRRDDWIGWQRLWTDYHAYGRTGNTSLPDAVTGVTWERFFQAHEPMEALLAELKGRLVGFAHILFHHTTSAFAPSCLLHDLFVEPMLHGRGIGRALIDAV